MTVYGVLVKAKMGADPHGNVGNNSEGGGYYQSFNVAADSIFSALAQIERQIDPIDEIEEIEAKKLDGASTLMRERVIDSTGRAFFEEETPSGRTSVFSRIFGSSKRNA